MSNKVVEDIKKRLCYIPQCDHDDEANMFEVRWEEMTMNYMLPDGAKIMNMKDLNQYSIKNEKYSNDKAEFVEVGRERFSAPRILFEPACIGLEADGIVRMI